MGSGPGPERIGSGRHRLCGARVLLQPRSDLQACLLLSPNSLFAWTGPAVSRVHPRAMFARRIMKCAPVRPLDPEPNRQVSLPTIA